MKVIDPTKQNVPGDMVNGLMILVRYQFCADMTGEEWGKHSHFVRRNVIMWPARYICDKKGFVLPGDRYEQIMRQIFLEIRQNMTHGPIKYWPGYLMKCVQEHWKHHWEEYYAESKSAANLAQASLAALQTLPQRSDGAVEAISAAHTVLSYKAGQRAKKKAAARETQMGLF